MRRASFFAVGLLLLVAGRCGFAAGVADFEVFSFTEGSTTLLPGRLYVPPEASGDPSRPRPLMVFLHGAGAVGRDNVTQIGPNHTPDYMLAQAKARGAFLYVPQTSSSWAAATVLDRVMAMIDRAVVDLNADDDRLYVIGSSLGGGGVWNLLSRHSGRFAAALSAAGVSPTTGFTPANLLSTAIIAVHARDDGVVSVNSSRTVVRSVLAAAGEMPPTYPSLASEEHWVISNPALEMHRTLLESAPPGVQFTNVDISDSNLDLLYYEMPRGGHGAPGGAFYNTGFYEWMFAHGGAVPEPRSVAFAGVIALGAFSRVRTRRTHCVGSAARRR
jgi:poly(3-hydroxybutyrate) depolymerase